MAFSSSTRHGHLLLLLVSTIICILVSTSKYGRAHEDPHLGAATAVAYEYVPGAEDEGGSDEYHDDHDHGHGVGSNPEGSVFTKALECFNDQNIYISCEEAYRLTQNGELNVPPEYTNQYCNGACLRETHLVLECIHEILKHFVFQNKATVNDVKETIKTGCSYGPKRGNFNVGEHLQGDEGSTSKISATVFYALALMIMAAWHALF